MQRKNTRISGKLKKIIGGLAIASLLCAVSVNAQQFINGNFETGDYTKAWNGKEPNGNSAPAGAYIYYLRIKSPNDQIIEERGNITVIYP